MSHDGRVSQTRYNGVAMSLHWIIAVLFIVMLFFGGDLIKVRQGGDTLLPTLHVSIGSAILLLSLLRLQWRLRSPPPPLPVTMAGWEILASHALHVLLYILMIGLPLTGWLAFSGYIVERPWIGSARIFWLFPVPGTPSIGLPMGGIHSLLSNVGIAAVGLHVLAALKHQFIDRDGVLRRMLPF